MHSVDITSDLSQGVGPSALKTCCQPEVSSLGIPTKSLGDGDAGRIAHIDAMISAFKRPSRESDSIQRPLGLLW